MIFNIRIIVLVFILELFNTCKSVNFEDYEGYLKRLDNYNEEITFKKVKNEEYDPIRDKSQRLKVETVDVDSDDPHDNDYYNKVIDQVPTPLSLRYLKESLDKDTACCMLGQIAGDKGYHCHAKFYSNNIMLRNRNRAHNRKLSFYGRDRMPHFGEKLMMRFEKCLAKKGFIFNRCCRMAAMEKENQLMPQYNTFKHNMYNLRQHNKVNN